MCYRMCAPCGSGVLREQREECEHGIRDDRRVRRRDGVCKIKANRADYTESC